MVSNGQCASSSHHHRRQGAGNRRNRAPAAHRAMGRSTRLRPARPARDGRASAGTTRPADQGFTSPRGSEPSALKGSKHGDGEGRIHRLGERVLGTHGTANTSFRAGASVLDGGAAWPSRCGRVGGHRSTARRARRHCVARRRSGITLLRESGCRQSPVPHRSRCRCDAGCLGRRPEAARRQRCLRRRYAERRQPSAPVPRPRLRCRNGP